MKKKICKMNEAALLLGIIFNALGVALCTKADFGLSMIAAPALIMSKSLTEISPFFTQGTMEYIFQAVLLIVTCLIVRRFRIRYLFSFVTAFLFGKTLDAWLMILGGSGTFSSMTVRVIAFIAGDVITGLAVAFYFRTRLPLQVYELIVAEVSDRYGFELAKVKYVVDASFLVLSVVLALVLFGGFEGIGIGTVITVLINGALIAGFGKLLDKFCDFSPMFPKVVDKLLPVEQKD